ncbi:hypothetical protein EW146_g9968 [Bondarzewia mesenterica]|uniref:Uncharacterized protein n=1 Tax=Bondarzewia mesenterica TaxID=1095465 RepID=A0A4S4L1V8_9AGAM|nr:hypothetical protein EW146_g9968 [Bondarzewia mesenterica]
MPPSSHAPQFTGNYGDKMIPFIGGGSLTIGPSQSSRGLEPPYQVYEGLQENPMPTMIEGYHIPTVHYDNPWQQLPDTAYPLPTSYYGGPIHGGHHPMIAAGDLSQYMEGIPLAAVPPFYGNMYRHGVHAHHHPYTPMPTIAPPLLVPALQNTPLVPTATAGDAIQSGIRNEAEGLPDIHHQPSEAQALPINNLTSENDIDEEYLLAGAPSPDTVQLSAGGHGTAPQAIVIQNAPGSRRSATETATKERSVARQTRPVIGRVSTWLAGRTSLIPQSTMNYASLEFVPSLHRSMLSGNFEDEVHGFMSGGSHLPNSSQPSGGFDPPYQVYEGLLENPTPTVIEGYHIHMMHHADPWQQPLDAAYPLPTAYYGGPIHDPMDGELSQYMARILPAHHYPYIPMPIIAPPPLAPSLQETPPVLDVTATPGVTIRSGIRYEHNKTKDLPGIQVLPHNNFTSETRNDEESLVAYAPSPEIVQLSAGGHSATPSAMTSQDIPKSWRSATRRAMKERRHRGANTPSSWACFHLACRKKGEPLYFASTGVVKREVTETKKEGMEEQLTRGTPGMNDRLALRLDREPLQRTACGSELADENLPFAPPSPAPPPSPASKMSCTHQDLQSYTVRFSLPVFNVFRIDLTLSDR